MPVYRRVYSEEELNDPRHKNFKPSEIAVRALNHLYVEDWEGPYNVVTNNCEHFATWAKFDRRFSTQAVRGVMTVGSWAAVTGIAAAAVAGGGALAINHFLRPAAKESIPASEQQKSRRKSTSSSNSESDTEATKTSKSKRSVVPASPTNATSTDVSSSTQSNANSANAAAATVSVTAGLIGLVGGALFGAYQVFSAGHQAGPEEEQVRDERRVRERRTDREIAY
ncbi:hypothetical protein HDU93_005853 [Gonapodya sp. JEL0774]|nr:hypothetical protein HDU93_005853 [Gonapodya sp. JEL0774]